MGRAANACSTNLLITTLEHYLDRVHRWGTQALDPRWILRDSAKGRQSTPGESLCTYYALLGQGRS